MNVQMAYQANLLLTYLYSILYLREIIFQIVGAENPVLMSAAEQIFGAGGKRVRPALVFLVSRATAEMSGLKWGTLFGFFSLVILNNNISAKLIS